MIRPALAVALLLLSSCANDGTERQRAAAPTAPLKIATWNLEHLAEANGVGCRPRTDADYAAMRAFAERLDADVIAFQEVETKAAAERVFPPATYTVVMSTRPDARRGGTCFGRTGLSILKQDVGFAIRNGVPFTRHDDVVALGLGNPDLRWGVDVTIDTPRPLRLLGMHLKSGCNSGRKPSDSDCAALFDQLPVVERWIDSRAVAGEPAMVLGDWNRRLQARGDAFYAEIDDDEPADADVTIASQGRVAACKARYREFIDHIVTTATATARVMPGSFEEFTYGVPEAAHPSDHCPVSVRVTMR